MDLSGPLPEVARRAAALAEEEAIRRAMQECDGDRNAAAERLGVSLSTLSRRLRAQAGDAAPASGDGGDED
jgi:DNA-binding NtrC family response regulator